MNYEAALEAKLKVEAIRQDYHACHTSYVAAMRKLTDLKFTRESADDFLFCRGPLIRKGK